MKKIESLEDVAREYVLHKKVMFCIKISEAPIHSLQNSKLEMIRHLQMIHARIDEHRSLFPVFASLELAKDISVEHMETEHAIKALMSAINMPPEFLEKYIEEMLHE
ncbi:hypothetical protein DRJ16_06260 [Candidatus Woesearchaeota archaeon]|nr:MAG: hypothetical protein DRJ16_06260 [Candidatus Woesearchaeota archaeon]